MQIILPNVRLAFPDLWTPGTPPPGSQSGPKYGCHGIMAPESEAGKIAQAAFIAVAKEKWGEQYALVLETIERNKKCIRNGNHNLDKTAQVRNGYAGNLYIVAKNKIKPVVCDRVFSNGKPLLLTEESGRPYGGCIVNLSVDLYAMEKPGQGKQLNATLLAVQFVEDGERFGGSVGSADVFSDLGGGAAFGGADAADVGNMFG